MAHWSRRNASVGVVIVVVVRRKRNRKKGIGSKVGSEDEEGRSIDLID
jgi:hypothetical protein